MDTVKRTTQAGFTLIEVLIVVAILGLIASIAVPAFNSSLERSASVRLIESVTDNVATSTQALLVTTGDVADVTTGTSSVPDANNSFLDVLVNGADFVSANFEQAYADAGIARLDRQVTVTADPVAGSSAGSYAVKNYAMTYSSPSAGIAQLQFAGVPSEVVERIKTNRESGAFTAGTADTTGPVQHDAATNGKHNLTMEIQLQ